MSDPISTAAESSPDGPAPEAAEAVSMLRENWGWFAAGALLLVLVYFLGPILTPFAIGAVLAYLGDPLVERLQRLGLPRTPAVLIVFLSGFGIAILAIVLVVPVLEEQLVILVGNVPEWLKWVQDVGLHRLGIRLPPGVRLDAVGLRNAITQHWSEAGDLASEVLGRISESTPVLLKIVADVILVPIVTFYLLRDWQLLVGRIDQLIPPRLRPRAQMLGDETNAVLNALIRGQLSVMAALALYYSVALSFTGLNIALLVGVVTGLMSFIPYLGYATGLAIAAVATLVQMQTLSSLVWVALVFGVGQLLENAVLTPLLIGDRIGLHPVAVIFAVLAGGELFGFTGVLVALPTAAVGAVLLRHARAHWLRSGLFVGRPMRPSAAPPPPLKP
jgi:predicted PurR-regulated permease PerM